MQKKWQRRWSRTVAATIFITTLGFQGYAMPEGGKITVGQGSFSQYEDTLMVTQGSDKMSVNWQSFNLSQHERIIFQQPSAGAIMLNRIIGNSSSAIYGKITANGKVFFINPNGILFGPGSQLDVGGVVASSLQLSDNDFMRGNYRFINEANGKVVNQGNISAAAGGYVLMLAPEVRNEGVVIARQGTVALGSGNQITLDFSGDGLINFKVDQGVFNAYAANKGIINAEGGLVVMSAKAADELIDTIVNNTGIIQAQSLCEKNGTIILEGGSSGVVSNSGMLDVSGRYNNETRGTVKVVGDKIALLSGSIIDAGSIAGADRTIGVGCAAIQQIILAHNVYLTTDNLSIDTTSGGIDASGGSIVIRPMTAGRSIQIGAKNTECLSLQPEEIKMLSADTLRIGDTANGIAGIGAGIASGDILVSNPTDFAGVAAVHLITPASVLESSSAGIMAANLAVTAGGAVNLSMPNTINRIAVSAGGAVVFHNSSADLSISSVDNVSGVSAGSYNTTLINSGIVSQDATIVSAGLELLGGGSYFLSQSGNKITTLAGDLGTLDFRNLDSFAVGKVNSTSGLNVRNSASLNASGTNADLKVSNFIEKTGAGCGFLDLKANRDVIIGYDISAKPGGGLWDITAGANGGGNGGVVSVTLSHIDSNGGDIVFGGGFDPLHIAAQGRGNTDMLKRGVFIGASEILSHGGDITIHGKGFSGYADNADGITVKVDSVLDSGTGKILLFGSTAVMSGEKSMGISISGYDTKLISSNADFDAISVTGCGTNAANNVTNYASYNGGVSIQYGASLLAECDGGGIYITGSGGNSQDSRNYGIILSTEGGRPITLKTTTGPISLIGTSGVNAAASGIYTTGRGNLVTSDTGNITLVSDTMSLNEITFKGSGVFSIKPQQKTGSIGLGTNAEGTLNLTAVELGTINDGFRKLVFGSEGNVGIVTVGTAVFSDPVEIYGGAIMLKDTLDAGMNAVKLAGTSAVTEQGKGVIKTSSLLVSAGDEINLGGENAVGTIALHSDGNGVIVNNGTNPLTIGMVGEVAGISAKGPITLLSGTDITLEQVVRSDGIGDAIIVAAGGNFINLAGASALQSARGRWLVYSNSPGLDTFGGLVSGGHALWGREYSGSSVGLPGNHYIFRYTPVLIFTTADIRKIYGSDAAALLDEAYTVDGIITDTYGGAILADTKADAFAGSPSLISTGAATTAHVNGSPYGINITQGTLFSSNGYTFDFVSAGKLMVDKRPIMVIANDRSKIYGEELTLGTGDIHVSETLPNGDRISGVTLASAGTAKTAHRGDGDKGNGQYFITAQNAVFDRGQSDDYTITYRDGTLAVTPRPIIVTADDRSKLYGDELVLGTRDFTVRDAANELPNGDRIDTVVLNSTGAAAAANRDEGDKGIGTYRIVPDKARFSRGSSNDYHIDYQEGKLEISPAVLTYLADHQMNYYGDALPDLTGNITGFVCGDTLTSSTSGKLAFITHATPSSPVGNYAITGGGLTAKHKNYVFVQSDGNARALTILDATRRNEAIAGIMEKTLTDDWSKDFSLEVGAKLIQSTNRDQHFTDAIVLNKNNNNGQDEGWEWDKKISGDIPVFDRLLINGGEGTEDGYQLTHTAAITKLTRQSVSGPNLYDMSISEITVFKVNDLNVKSYGTYVVTDRGDELTLETFKFSNELIKKVSTIYKDTYVAVSLGSLGTGVYRVGFNGIALYLYPLDDGARMLIKVTEADGNRSIVCAALLTGIRELGVSLEEIQEVHLYAHDK